MFWGRGPWGRGGRRTLGTALTVVPAPGLPEAQVRLEGLSLTLGLPLFYSNGVVLQTVLAKMI